MQTVLSILWILFLIVQAIVVLYVLVPFVSLLSYFVIRLFRFKTPYDRKPFLTDKNFEFGFIVTAHQEVQFILPIVDSILKQTYRNFHVYVVADDCDLTSLHFTDTRVTILKPEPALHAKIKSIRYALAHFNRKHDAVIILDSDNLIHPNFLDVMNNHFRKGYRVVQCDFKPKNTDTVYARMDAIGDMFNFFTDREARMRLGLSASIWGSGVAIDYDLYNEVEYNNFLGGFDKKLQAHLVQRVNRIAFAPEAILYDEKIASGKSLETQRTRWISAYFKYFNESWAIFRNGLKTANLNLMYFGFTALQPPLFIVLGAALLFTVVDYFVHFPLFIAWLVILLSFVLSFIGIVALKGKSLRYLQALFMIPVFVLRQVMALFKMGKAKKSFLKTQHTELVFIDDILKKNFS
jgi:cellulose synthase/poly-beta-1,6-N-acetylglucosamine synthase-like glycosyltransferase